MKFGLGQSVPRYEDPRLLRGGGQYTDDLNRPGQAAAMFCARPMPMPASPASIVRRRGPHPACWRC